MVMKASTFLLGNSDGNDRQILLKALKQAGVDDSYFTMDENGNRYLNTDGTILSVTLSENTFPGDNNHIYELLLGTTLLAKTNLKKSPWQQYEIMHIYKDALDNLPTSLVVKKSEELVGAPGGPNFSSQVVNALNTSHLPEEKDLPIGPDISHLEKNIKSSNVYTPTKPIHLQLKKVDMAEKDITSSMAEEKDLFSKYEGVTNLPAYYHHKRVQINFEPIAVNDELVLVTLKRSQRTHLLGFDEVDYRFTVTDTQGKNLADKIITSENINDFFQTLYRSKHEKERTMTLNCK